MTNKIIPYFRTVLFPKRKISESKPRFDENNTDLIFYDDCYPHPASGFRKEEFTTLLSHFKSCLLYASGSTYHTVNLTSNDHLDHIENLTASNTELKNKIQQTAILPKTTARLFYCLFLNNIHSQLKWLEKNRIPFAFTLYPGGGFAPGDSESDAKLKEVLASKMFRHVIVTQNHTYKHLIDNKLCPPEQIKYIFGVVVPQQSLFTVPSAKKYYPNEKPYLDICFCAMKYTEYGEDKGYPQFIKLITLMAEKYSHLRFHVVGNFDENVLDISSVSHRLTFHGILDYEDLSSFFAGMDLLISPNQAGKIRKGSFDGFPLGSTIEAALNEVAVMITDPNEENRFFENDTDILLLDPTGANLTQVFEKYIANPEMLYQIARNGRMKFQHLYSHELQMKPRISLLESLLDEKDR